MSHVTHAITLGHCDTVRLNPVANAAETSPTCYRPFPRPPLLFVRLIQEIFGFGSMSALLFVRLIQEIFGFGSMSALLFVRLIQEIFGFGSMSGHVNLVRRLCRGDLVPRIVRRPSRRGQVSVAAWS